MVHQLTGYLGWGRWCKYLPMKNKMVLLLGIFFLCCKHEKREHPVVIIETSLGDIYVELYTKNAPKTCANFLQHVDDKLYDNSNFYRVLSLDNQPSDAPKSELIQGGIWHTNNDKATSLKGIAHEGTNITGLSHVRGAISLARQDTGTANTEFFICLENDAGLDYGGQNNADGQGYATFGRVIKGMNVVQKIYNAPERDQYYRKPIPIYKIKRDD